MERTWDRYGKTDEALKLGDEPWLPPAAERGEKETT
jgi:hypothetical protein